MVDIVSLGEPLLEFNATSPGPLRTAREFSVSCGGDTSNFAIAAARLGASAGYLTRVGDDGFGTALLDAWRSEGVDTTHVHVEPGGFTGIYFISCGPDGHNFTYYRAGSAASGLSQADVPESYLADARLLHVSGITQAISTSACDAAFHAIDLAKRNGTLVSYDPNLRAGLWKPALSRAVAMASIAMADVVLPNLDEGRLLTGYEDPHAVVAALRDRTQGLVVLKLGSAGALVGIDDGTFAVAPHQVDAVDATGAGDTFDAAFVVRLLMGESAEDAARFAVVAAALTTLGRGATESIPTIADVRRRIGPPHEEGVTT